jgi:hypothetical protein
VPSTKVREIAAMPEPYNCLAICGEIYQRRFSDGEQYDLQFTRRLAPHFSIYCAIVALTN